MIALTACPALTHRLSEDVRSDRLGDVVNVDGDRELDHVALGMYARERPSREGARRPDVSMARVGRPAAVAAPTLEEPGQIAHSTPSTSTISAAVTGCKWRTWVTSVLMPLRPEAEKKQSGLYVLCFGL